MPGFGGQPMLTTSRATGHISAPFPTHRLIMHTTEAAPMKEWKLTDTSIAAALAAALCACSSGGNMNVPPDAGVDAPPLSDD
ncbi:MAG TPA: hypothetical protein VIX73_01895, partial [Kofleriaceae bacterium]